MASPKETILLEFAKPKLFCILNSTFRNLRKYMLDLLRDTRKLACKPTKTPLELTYKDHSEGESFPDIEQYRRAIGTPTHGLWMLCNNATNVTAYCDVDWERIVLIDVLPLASALSSVETSSLGRAKKRMLPPVEVAFHIAANSVYHECTKHIELHYHFIRERISNGTNSTIFTRSSGQVVDIFTKTTSSSTLQLFLRKIGLVDNLRPILRGNDTTHKESNADLGPN
ncbi:PREDICTED: uncharacterized protein LOC104825737 [Tarenaya hassleriana]|uniref:uncharacterized protein LOC104825737 n=1 Tax=Tarenaya hassleriana TaxID=28532 RepID=UPI00053C8FF9|nr:PREDICTED: uncharacterized protein LOC104825737 [Tarenaya hassleriana]